MTLSKNIRFLRAKNGWGQDFLAEKLGYKSYTTIQKWESGVSNPPLKTLDKLAKIFGVDIDDLNNKDLTIPSPPKSRDAPLSVRIPVLGSVPAGIPLEAVEDIVDWEDIPREWTKGGKDFFGLKVKGDSMYPKYIEGDTIILRKADDCESGDDCVVYVNGYDATLKKVIKKTDCIILQPLNVNYEPRVYDYNSEEEPVIVAGVVVEIRRKV